MNKSKLMSLIVYLAIILALFAGNSPVVNASSFSDVYGHEFYAEAAEVLSTRGLISGYADGEFKADKSITRAEITKLICVMYDAEAAEYAKELMDWGFVVSFNDVDANHWAMPYILYASDRGIVNGYDDGTFRPEAPVLYEEAVKMIVCALGLDYHAFNYPDDWAQGYIDVAEMFGFTKDCYCERGWYANRGHVAVMLYNATKYIDRVYEPDDSETDFGYEDESYEEPDYGTRGPGEYLLTFEKSDAGVIDAVSGYYKPGDEIKIKARANIYYGFMSWSSDCGGEFYNVFKKETTFTMPANDVVISASYIADYSNTGSDEPEDNSDALDRYDGQNINLNKYVRLTMKMVGCGSYRDLTGPYHPGQVVELRIGAGDEGIFLGWSSDDVDLPTPYSPSCKIVIPDHDVTVTATFSE